MTAASKLSPSFSWLNVTQFLGALNDNVFKLIAIYFLIGVPHAAKPSSILALGSALFALPFLLFTPAAGILADRFSKRNIIVVCKVLEVVAMVAGAIALAAGAPWMVYGVVFLMGAQSALFGPSKYGIIPELVGKEKLSIANGYIVLMTYTAIILGTTLAPAISQGVSKHYATAALVCVGIAVAGALASLLMVRTPAAGSARSISLFFLRDVTRTLKEIRTDHYLMMAILAGAFFNLIGAYTQQNVLLYGIQVLGLDELHSTYLFLVAAIGIGLGGVCAGKLSGRNVELGIVPLGAFGLAVTLASLSFVPVNIPLVAVIMFLLGLSAGLFIVPLDAFIQWRSRPEKRGEVLAASGFLNWVGILLSAGLVFGLSSMGLGAAGGFAFVGILTLVLTVLAIRVLPDFLVRFIALVLTRCVYRIRTIGSENVPLEGGALLVSNHVSLADALLILATQQRRIRFMMHRRIYEGHPFRRLFQLMGVIPIAMEDPPKKIVESLRRAREELDKGYMVCIFAEGALTRTGMIQEFKPGFERIVKGSGYPIIPIYLGGAWGSIFSHYYGKKRPHIPGKFPYPVTVIFGKPLPATAKSHEVRIAVLELSCRYFEDRKEHRESIGTTFVRTMRKNWSRQAMSDTTGKRLTFGRVLAGALALARELDTVTEGQNKAGVLIPTSVGGALVNIALMLRGKVAVNLNFTASNEAFQSAIRQAGLKTIITSRAFIEKMPALGATPGLVYLEDLAARIAPFPKCIALLKARFLPVTLITSARNFGADELATIIFSSGTTGEPKGVMLSHHNLLSNVESITMVFRPKDEDNLFAALPFFHSFGYLCGIWFPMLTGVPVSYHSNPMDGAKTAEVVRTNKCTALFATPTFLMAYVRRAEREDFKSLRMVVVGAEKLKKRVAEAFEARFGFKPLEGFGATELSPVAALSIPDVATDGVYQPGARAGCVGQPLPGVAVKVVDLETGATLPPNTPGHLLVKGPNVMLGYLDRPDLTAEVIKDGWYHTGDIATIDEDGFITITDRLARFSKIGGEMVPHMAIEDVYLKVLNKAEVVVAVTSIADDKRGERLIVLYVEAAGDPAALHAIIEQSDLPNLWKPDRSAYVKVERIPVTGTGKLDVRTLRVIAVERTSSPKS
ncbi:MAG: acyl-[ACP]--phospholipid O-acyltransferase [bacterium]